MDGNSTIRLLSCSSLESAQELSRALGSRRLLATDGLVRVHEDGGITTVARMAGGDIGWYELKQGVRTTRTHTPLAPADAIKDKDGKFVQMGEMVDDITKGAGKLANNLSGTLKATFDDIVGAGIKYVDDGNSIKFINNAGREIATIVSGKFTPTEWTLQRKSKGTLISHTDEGYKLIKNGNDYAFELGYKEGRSLSAEEVNIFHKAVGNHEPYRPLTSAIERNLQSGDKIYIRPAAK